MQLAAPRTIVRFDKLLTELHRTTDDKATVCGDPMPTDNSIVWVDWPDDGTPHFLVCYGEVLQEEAMF